MELSALTGTPKQIKFALDLRKKAIDYIWKQGWHGTQESFAEDISKLPTDAAWWIEKAKPIGSRTNYSAHEAAREFLGLEYITPAGSDY